MESREKFMRREKALRDRDTRFIVVLCIALFVSVLLLAESAYFCWTCANLPAIVFTVLFSAATLLFAIMLGFEIRAFRKDDMP